ncbi:MAG TPA: DUF6597 domain-containing transcriptional factor, partial [Thermoanaerobaculia bacterium]|nr:DUF6597 domain-containing transcriptional factor [Thermoanaerobaculia bacterium]
MLFLHHRPQPPLSWFVDLLWLYEGGQTPHARERLLPTGTVEVVFSFEEEPMRVFDREDRLQTFRGSVICGPHSKYFAIDSSQQGLVMGIHFHPGGTFPFFDLPAAELQNLHLGLETLWGDAAGEIRERVMAVAEPEAKLRLLERLLLDRAIRPLGCHPAVAFALRELQTVPNARTVGEVTDQIGLSPKHFIRVFSEAVGLTPKLFCRVRRFQEAIARIHEGRRVDWTAVALDCGY